MLKMGFGRPSAILEVRGYFEGREMDRQGSKLTSFRRVLFKECF